MLIKDELAVRRALPQLRHTTRDGLGSTMMIFVLVLATLTGCGAVRLVSASSRPEPSHSASASAVTPPIAGWDVNASNVGLAPFGLSCDSLPRYSGDHIVRHGSVISGMLIPIALDLSEGDITIDRSCIQPTSVGSGMPVVTTINYNTMGITEDPVVIRNSEFDGSRLDNKSAAMSAAFIGIADLRRNYFHGFGSGIALMDTGTRLDSIVEENYVTGLVAWGDPAKNGNHSDAFTIRDFSAAEKPDREVVIRHNRFDCDSGNDSGAVFLQTYAGRIDNVLLEGNLLEGNNYQLQVGKLDYPYTNIRAINNRMSGTGYGPLNVQGGPGFAEFTRNYIYKTNGVNGEGTLISR